MRYGLVLERIVEENFPAGHYYAHIPSLGLTTHGLGVEGAKVAARELLQLWIAEKKAHNETPRETEDFFFSTVELSDDALQSA